MPQESKSFLRRVAEAQWKHYGTRLSDVTYVFPNRRAGLFFQKYLTELSPGPLLSPAVLTESQLFQNISGMRAADPIGMQFKVFKLYRALSGSGEEFDDFIYWAETILSDFSEVDIYRVDARRLFVNLNDLKNIRADLADYLTADQIELIEQFWGTVVPLTQGQGGLNRSASSAADEAGVDSAGSFVSMWSLLYPLYERLTALMESERSGYEGFIQKKALELLAEGHNPYRGKDVVFVGFNALTPSDVLLFRLLQQEAALHGGVVDFYWDYDAAEVQELTESGRPFARNAVGFPSRLTVAPVVESLRAKADEGRLHLYALTSSVGQAKKVGQLLDGLMAQADCRRDLTETAVVIPEESLLIPMLHSLPGSVDKVNVTMGFPLKMTPVAALTEGLYALQLHRRTRQGTEVFYYKQVMDLLNNLYIARLAPKAVEEMKSYIMKQNKIYISAAGDVPDHPLLRLIFAAADGTGLLTYLYNVCDHLYTQFRKEELEAEFRLDRDYLLHYMSLLNRVRNLFDAADAPGEVRTQTLVRMLRQIVASDKISFDGEPLEGLQIMGMLETRGLDFRHLIITSMNEGIFPRKQQDNSFVPYNLRRAYGLPTYESRDAVFAYNFYRLIHHAETIHFLYDTRTGDDHSGEMSRYLYQLIYQYNLRLSTVTISAGEDPSAAAGSVEAADERLQAGELCSEMTPADPLFLVGKDEAVLRLLDLYTRPAPDGGKPAAFSASALKNYLRCPAYFYFNNLMRLKESEEVTEEVESNVFGTIFHEVMEQLYAPGVGRSMPPSFFADLRKDPDARLMDLIDKAILKHQWKQPDVELTAANRPQGYYRLVANVIHKYFKLQLQHDQADAPVLLHGMEQEYWGSIGLADGRSVNLHGFIDRIDSAGGTPGVRIIDYKTGHNPGSGRLDLDKMFSPKADARLLNTFQVFFYSHLYDQHHHSTQPVEPHLFYVSDLNNTRIADNYLDLRDDFRQRLAALMEEIYNPSIPINRCEDKQKCRSAASDFVCPFVDLCGR